jgi:hypothetical protein
MHIRRFLPESQFTTGQLIQLFIKGICNVSLRTSLFTYIDDMNVKKDECPYQESY